MQCPSVRLPGTVGLGYRQQCVRDQLLAARLDIKGMAALIGVDSLAFLSIDGLYRAMGEAGRAPRAPRFCDACFTGDYPIPPIDAEDGKISIQLSLLAEPA